MQLPLWRSARPALEVWVVVDDGRGRTVMPLELDYLQDALGDVAQGRGQPLLWPRPDEDGMYPVDMQLLWGGYTEELASATGVGVLILAARREGVEWGVRANLGFRGEHLSSRLRDIDLERALDAVLAAGRMAVALPTTESVDATLDAVTATLAPALRRQLTCSCKDDSAMPYI